MLFFRNTITDSRDCFYYYCTMKARAYSIHLTCLKSFWKITQHNISAHQLPYLWICAEFQIVYLGSNKVLLVFDGHTVYTLIP